MGTSSPLSIDELLIQARARFRRLTPREAHAESAKGALLVDTRCGEALREDGQIPEAIHVPLSVLPWRFDPRSDFRDEALARPDRRVILFCAHGFSSSLAVATLMDLGYTAATDVEGGFQAWLEAGLPVNAGG
jgi:rhodanese-related sulfurtransferase